MLSTELLQTAAQWSGILTGVCALLTVVGFLLKWGIRFRLVGVTGFMAVLTGGIFALSLGLYTRPSIPNAVRFARVYDTASTQAVIAVPPTVTREQLEATLQQAAADLYSPGRLASGEDRMTIRARTIIHPEPGVSQPLYLGEIKRSLSQRQDDQMTIQLYRDNLAKLPSPAA